MPNIAYISAPPHTAQGNISSVVAQLATTAGFLIRRRLDITTSTKLTTEVLDNLRAASVVIADITHNAPNVLFEVGFAQSLGKPVLLIAERGSPTPFDMAGVFVVTYSEEESYQETVNRLAAAINSFAEKIEHGISESLDRSLEIKEEKKCLFISYSHKDKQYLDRLLVHLQPMEVEGNLDLWVDTRLRTGDKWKEEIENALSRSAVVIVLASADYLASEFIRNNELPQMLAAAEEKGTRILPLILKPCRFTRHESLKHFQALNDPANPIALLSEDQREVFYDQLAREVEHHI